MRCSLLLRLQTSHSMRVSVKKFAYIANRPWVVPWTGTTEWLQMLWKRRLLLVEYYSTATIKDSSTMAPIWRSKQRVKTTVDFTFVLKIPASEIVMSLTSLLSVYLTTCDSFMRLMALYECFANLLTYLRTHIVSVASLQVTINVMMFKLPLQITNYLHAFLLTRFALCPVCIIPTVFRKRQNNN